MLVLKVLLGVVIILTRFKVMRTRTVHFVLVFVFFPFTLIFNFFLLVFPPLGVVVRLIPLKSEW